VTAWPAQRRQTGSTRVVLEEVALRALVVLLMASGVLGIGCGQAADSPAALRSPAAPILATGSSEAAAKAAAPGEVELPFHSEIAWAKVVNGRDAGPCQGLHGDPPNGMIYLMRNTSEGPAVTTRLGVSDFEIHTCVYGTMVNETKRPAGWRADLRWTSANGDVLLATSQFLYWTGQPSPVGVYV
jgi:hypothetical protein